MNETYELVKKLYKNDYGKPFELTEGQLDIFNCIAKRKHKRNHIVTYTQYGKTEVVSMAVLTRVINYPEKWAIVAPTLDKAKIMMGCVIKHIFDNELAKSRFKIGKDESLERIRRERSKERLTFRLGEGIGEIFIVSAESTRKGEDAGNKLMGYGAPNVIEDESALIDDPVEEKITRMVGGHTDNFRVKIGNPFRYNNHFHKASFNPKYHKIKVDLYQGIKEGRQNQDFLDEVRDNRIFGILYECKFPDPEAIDSEGYSPLLLERDLRQVKEIQLYGDLHLGCDIAGEGKNSSVIVLKGENGAKVLYRENNPNIMSFTGIILQKMGEYKIRPENTHIDATGSGEGVYKRLDEQRKGIDGVVVGRSSIVLDGQGELKYKNLKSEAYCRMADWIKGGASLLKNDNWNELLKIRYQVYSDKVIEIMPKKMMRRLGVVSPDVAEALMLVFSKPKKKKITPLPKQPYYARSEYEGVGEEMVETGIDIRDFEK